ncbi:MAG: FimV/HubP family polar landmark protein [Burkholderiaceae bacterium]
MPASPATPGGSTGLARLHAVAAAALLCTSLTLSPQAHALGLGRIVVQSALGEPLRAQIDVPEINAAEAESLRVSLAPQSAYRAAGMEISPALFNLQITLQRRPDGSAYLQLSSPRAINEAFLDLIVEANWASGKLVRDYTLLFDPPRTAQPVPAPLPPATSAAPASAAPAPTTAAPATASSTPVTPPVTPAARPPVPAPDMQVLVERGDTAGRIAMANLPANVSLDQMLVAMLRSNPKAFINNNVNRVRAGAVLDMPTAESAGEVSASEARQIIAAQARDFNEFRRRLAARAPDAGVAAADRQAAGQVQAEVQETRPQEATADRLTLARPGDNAKEAEIAKDRQSKEESTRVAELSRNIEELNRLGSASAPAATPAPAPAPASAATTPQPTPPSAPAEVAAGPGVSTPPALAPATGQSPSASQTLPPEPAEAAPSAAAPAPVPGAAPADEAPHAPAPAPAAPPPPPPAPAPVPEEPGLVDRLMENPLMLPLAGGLLALLAGLGIYRARQRKKAASVDSSFLESRLQPDSFFGSSGGQRIDTAESAASGSSMVYSPSQLDAAGDVDPVAEADVYLAYGRDLQAEEILKEAMRSTPTRVAIHNKLLEIYAKRRDAKAFEVVAIEAYGLTQGEGTEWEHACDLGRELDPDNALYQPGGRPPSKAGIDPTGPAGVPVNTMPFSASTLAQGAAGSTVASGRLDLDLDFSGDDVAAPAQDPVVSGMDDLGSTEALTAAPSALADAAPQPAVAESPASNSMDFDLDLDLPSAASPSAGSAAPAVADEPQASIPPFDADEVLPDFDLGEEEPQPLDLDMPSGSAALSDDKAGVPAADMLSFDLGDLNLDLNAPADAVADSVPGGLSEENPLDTKLSLAEEFRAIGDLEGARSLAEEVLAEATGTLKTKARTFLSDLS